jgi:periplasmic copper chaperone A
MNTQTPRARRTLKAAAVLAVTAGLMTFGLGAALAHVTVSPTSTSEGGFSQLTFSVPNESETASTNKLEVTLPTDTPFTSVSVKPIDGWTAEVIETELPEPVEVNGATVTRAATSVVWTADEAHHIGPNQYQTFSISVGRLPAEGTTVLLPAAQSYTDGTVVNWSEPHAEGQEEPELPAPSIITTAAGGSGDEHTVPDASSDAEATDTEAASSNAASDGGGSAQALGWTGLVAGLLGLAAGGTALARTRGIRKG